MNTLSNKNNILCMGLPVSRGVCIGRVLKLDDDCNKTVGKDDILVLPCSDPVYAVKIMSAGGLIIERGGRLAHLCIVALEMGIPCITQVERARKILDNGRTIMLDASEGIVYGIE